MIPYHSVVINKLYYFKSWKYAEVTHDIGDKWHNVKSGINQDTLQNTPLQRKVILPVFSS